jgi:DNA-binding transcriptional LysR family regulator
LPLLIVGPLLEDGTLVQVLPEVLVGAGRVAIVYPERELVPPQVRAFVDHVIAWAPGGLLRATPGVRSPLKKSRRRTK